MFPEICSEICPEILSEISRAFLAGRNVHPPNFHQIFPIGDFKFQIELQIKFHQKFHKRTSAGLAALRLSLLFEPFSLLLFLGF